MIVPAAPPAQAEGQMLGVEFDAGKVRPVACTHQHTSLKNGGGVRRWIHRGGVREGFGLTLRAEVLCALPQQAVKRHWAGSERPMNCMKGQ